jgi:hypothetical protein
VDVGAYSSGQYTSLVLDSGGNPVVSYFNGSLADLKLARLGVDVTPPSVTINQSIEDPTYSRTIRFFARFTEPVTGITGDGFIVGGTAGATTARISSGTPDRTGFFIEVTGMTSSGTVIASVRANAAVDAAGLGNTSSTSTDNTVAYIRDTDPPTCVVTATPSKLWPPNHKMVNVTTAVSVSDSGSGPNGAYLESVTSNEADSGLGTDDVPGDIEWFDTTIRLRSERFANVGRVYTPPLPRWRHRREHVDLFCHREGTPQPREVATSLPELSHPATAPCPGCSIAAASSH